MQWSRARAPSAAATTLRNFAEDRYSEKGPAASSNRLQDCSGCNVKFQEFTVPESPLQKEVPLASRFNANQLLLPASSYVLTTLPAELRR